MILNMTHYYFFKKLIKNIPQHLNQHMEYDDDLLFNLSTFNNVGTFFKIFNPIKIDKYKLDDKLRTSQFNTFIMDCLYICKKKNNHKQLLFIYAMVAHNILDLKLKDYLEPKVTKKLSYEKICNMIDYYYALENDNLDLTKVKLSKIFPNGFKYYDYMDTLISNPFIKNYSTFCTKQYYKKSFKRKEFFYKHFTHTKTKLKYIPYFLYDLIFNHRGKPKALNYIYKNKIDPSILNLSNSPYLVKDETFNLSIEDIINEAFEQTSEYIEAINTYVINDNPKPLKKAFKITTNLMDETDDEDDEDEEFEGLSEEDKKLSKLFKLAKMENEEKKAQHENESTPSEKELRKLEKQKSQETKKKENEEETSSLVEENESTPSEKELRKLEKQKAKEIKKLEKQMKKSLDNDDTNQEPIELENE